MVKKIVKLKSFGCFQNFTWGTLDNLKAKNLFYGWNYSGKTTYSKFFQLLEFKDENKYFFGNEFEIELDFNGTSKIINKTNIQEFPFLVKVFNTEYIKRIFTWDDPKSDIEPISFYLGDPAGNIKSEIDKLEKRNSRLNNIKDIRYNRILEIFKDYNKQNGKFSEKAKDIRENYLPRLLQQNEFNKSHIQTITDLIKNDILSYILSENEKDETKKLALAQNIFSRLSEDYKFVENLLTISAEVKATLEDSAPKTISFPELDNDKSLFDWIQKGITLHEDLTKCRFCTNDLPPNRIMNLNAYYSTKLQEIQKSISTLKTKITAEIEQLDIAFPDEMKIAEAFRSKYINGIQKFNNTKIQYLAQLRILESDLNRKETEIFNSIAASSIEIVSFVEAFEIIENTIKEHNLWYAEFGKRKSIATEKILKNYVAEYLRDENYIKKESEFTAAQLTITKIDNIILDNNASINVYKAQLSDKVKGKDELNTSLKILLHRDDIKIDIKDEKYILQRNGYSATNLSEGEKSAIAFSYFLTELKSLRVEAKLSDTIIFIDDPISSLDSNHIFQVRSLLQSFFKSNDFRQLLISTHNFDFFSMLMDSSELFKRQEIKAEFYLIKRNDSNYSEIIKLPDTFKKYNSEYVSLFHILKEYNDLIDKTTYEYTILLPNAMRRFLEMYTAMKYPSSKLFDDRIREVFSSNDGTYHNAKLLHWFSHQKQFEKVQQHDDKLFQIEEAISELLNYIENNDELHWRGLNGL